MFKQLISALRGESTLREAKADFSRMLELAQEMFVEASAVYWGKPLTPERRTALYEKDVEVNRMQRQIRKQIVAHLGGPSPSDVTYGLLLMSLVKDVERIGDYAKNLLEVPDLTGWPVPREDTLSDELGELRRKTEDLSRSVTRVIEEFDRNKAHELTIEGRTLSKRCDDLLRKVARGDYKTGEAVNLTLGIRFYKRVVGHLLNLLSSVIMPLHKLDYFDESALDEG